MSLLFYDNVVLAFSPGDEFSPETLSDGSAWLLDKDGIDLKNYVDRPRRITPCYVTLRIIRKPNPSIDPFTATAASHSGGGQNTDPQSMDYPYGLP